MAAHLAVVEAVDKHSLKASQQGGNGLKSRTVASLIKDKARGCDWGLTFQAFHKPLAYGYRSCWRKWGVNEAKGKRLSSPSQTTSDFPLLCTPPTEPCHGAHTLLFGYSVDSTNVYMCCFVFIFFPFSEAMSPV